MKNSCNTINHLVEDFMRPYVVHIITGLGTGGAEIMLYRLLSNTDSENIKSHVIVLTDQRILLSSIEEIGVPVTVLGIKGVFSAIPAFFKLILILKKERPTIVQTWLYHADFMGFIAAKLAGIKTVIWNLRCSNLKLTDVPRSTWILIGLLARLSRFVELVIVNSHAGEKSHKALGYAPKRWENISNGFDLEKFKPDLQIRQEVRSELGINIDDPIIGLVGRWHPMKDHLNFLKAASLVQSRVTNAQFVLVGSGIDFQNEQLFSLICKLNLMNNIRLLGERADISRLICSFDICASSSYSEGFPTTIGEAMASGVPCVATDVGDTRLVIGNCGILVRPESPEELAEGLIKLLSLPSHEKIDLDLASRSYISQKFSIKKIASEYCYVYNNI